MGAIQGLGIIVLDSNTRRGIALQALWETTVKIRDCAQPFLLISYGVFTSEEYPLAITDKLAQCIPTLSDIENLKRLVQDAENQRIFISENLWRLFKIFVDFTMRLLIKLSEEGKGQAIYTWDKDWHNKPDAFVLQLIASAFTEAELAAIIEREPNNVGTGYRIFDELVIKTFIAIRGDNMAKYPLIERQKDMIRAIARGLKAGVVKTEWHIVYAGGDIIAIYGLDDDNKLSSEERGAWKNAKPGDFEKFRKCGFLEFSQTRRGSPEDITLDEYLIIEALDADFEMSDQTNRGQVKEIHISGNFSGANVNIASTLTSVQQTIGSSPNIDAAVKAQLTELVKELNKELEIAPDEYHEEAEAAAECTEIAVNHLNSGTPNKAMLKISADGLKKATEKLGAILPKVAELGIKIALLIEAARGTTK